MGICSGTESWYGWRQLNNKSTSSSPRFSVVHCHVQLKWALTIEGTDMTAVLISVEQRCGDRERATHLIEPAEYGPCDLFEVLREQLGVQDRVFADVEVLGPTKRLRSASLAVWPLLSQEGGLGFCTRAADAALPP